ncbi:MAG: hypothetical protein A2039_00175 [Candidatus Melainabacteria bacterium GWA2_34_9]|nr:MAG: hypothetical protein A2039_00175 [Candidatus Melainabacteria bacterium GWA2_34_9]
MMRYLYTITYAIVIMAAVSWGFAATTSEPIPLVARLVDALVGVCGLIQIMLNIQGYKLAGNYVR